MFIFLYTYLQQILSDLRDFGLFILCLFIVSCYRGWTSFLLASLTTSSILFFHFFSMCLFTKYIFVICLITERSLKIKRYVLLSILQYDSVRNHRLWIGLIGQGRLTLKRFTVDIFETLYQCLLLLIQTYERYNY